MASRPLASLGYGLLRGWAVKKRWTLRRFTPAGRLVLLVYTLSLPFVVDVRRTTIYQLFVFSIALIAVAVAVGLRHRARLALSRRVPAMAVAGEPVVYEVEIRNLRPTLQQGIVLMEDPAWTAPPLSAVAHLPVRALFRLALSNRPEALIPAVAVPPIPPAGSRRLRLQATPLRRGVLVLEGATLAVPDPLGLFHGFTFSDTQDTLLVLPRRYRVPALRLPARRTCQPQGLRQALQVGDSQEFAGLREYRPGDPIRHIHWPSLARLGVPAVKEFHEEWTTRQALVLDTAPWRLGPQGERVAVDPQWFEEAVSVAASFVMVEPDVESRDAIQDLLFQDHGFQCLNAGRGLGQPEALLRALAGVQCTEEDVRPLADALSHHAPRLGGAVLVLLAWDAPRQALIESLLTVGLALRVFVIDKAVPPSRPDWLMVLRPGRIQEDLLA